MIFIAGAQADINDLSDWDIDEIPVYFNASGLPSTATVEDIIVLIKESCRSWTLRWELNYVYAGLTQQAVVPGAVVINYADSTFLRGIMPGELAGLCRYHATRRVFNKWILDGCEIYINSTNRPLANDAAHGTILHELGHACGIHGHNNDAGSVMFPSSSGRYKLQLVDCQMLDRWNPHTVEMHKDRSLSVPAVTMPSGAVEWFELPFKPDNSLSLSWGVGKATAWNGPFSDNVTIGDNVDRHGFSAQRIHMRAIQGSRFNGGATFLLLNNTLILEFAQ